MTIRNLTFLVFRLIAIWLAFTSIEVLLVQFNLWSGDLAPGAPRSMLVPIVLFILVFVAAVMIWRHPTFIIEKVLAKGVEIDIPMPLASWSGFSNICVRLFGAYLTLSAIPKIAYFLSFWFIAALSDLEGASYIHKILPDLISLGVQVLIGIQIWRYPSRVSRVSEKESSN